MICCKTRLQVYRIIPLLVGNGMYCSNGDALVFNTVDVGNEENQWNLSKVWEYEVVYFKIAMNSL